MMMLMMVCLSKYMIVVVYIIVVMEVLLREIKVGRVVGLVGRGRGEGGVYSINEELYG